MCIEPQARRGGENGEARRGASTPAGPPRQVKFLQDDAFYGRYRQTRHLLKEELPVERTLAAESYHSVNPFVFVGGAEDLIGFLVATFGGTET